MSAFMDQLRRVIGHHPAAISNTPDFASPSWDHREDAAMTFALVDFGCNFKKGKCAGQRDGQRGECACCSGCANYAGYFKTINPDDIPLFESLFDKATGFWRKGEGCILPRNKRSEICLTYRCDCARNNAPRAFLMPWLQQMAQDGILHYSYQIRGESR